MPNDSLPKHIAIIMDGNGRWAQARGKPRLEGHRAGAKSVRTIVEECRRLGVRYLTLYSFSTENWQRPPREVSGLMSLFEQYLDSELNTLLQNDIRLRAIGQLDRLPATVRKLLERNMEATKNAGGMDLILALSYGGREEIVSAARGIATKVISGTLSIDEITPECFRNHLWTAGVPDPDLLIRTSGELRVSNFLLWQNAYAEIVVVQEYWPEFGEPLLHHCLAEFNRRKRRYGLTQDQLERVADNELSE